MTWHPVAELTILSILGRGKLSFGHALLRASEIYTRSPLAALLLNHDHISNPSGVVDRLNELCFE
jgi:hypothetical protein